MPVLPVPSHHREAIYAAMHHNCNVEVLSIAGLMTAFLQEHYKTRRSKRASSVFINKMVCLWFLKKWALLVLLIAACHIAQAHGLNHREENLTDSASFPIISKRDFYQLRLSDCRGDEGEYNTSEKACIPGCRLPTAQEDLKARRLTFNLFQDHGGDPEALWGFWPIALLSDLETRLKNGREQSIKHFDNGLRRCLMASDIREAARTPHSTEQRLVSPEAISMAQSRLEDQIQQEAVALIHLTSELLVARLVIWYVGDLLRRLQYMSTWYGAEGDHPEWGSFAALQEAEMETNPIVS